MSDDEELETVDLRAEGVVAARSPRTIVASVALFAPPAYAAAVVLRDSPHAVFTRVAIGAVALALVAKMSSALDELASDTRSAGRVALATAAIAGILAAGLPLHRVDTSALARIAAAISAAISAAAAVRCAAGIVGLGGIGAVGTDRIVRTSRRVAVLWLLTGASTTVQAARWARVPLLIAAVAATVAHLFFSSRTRRDELGARERYDLLLGAGALTFPFAVAIGAGFELAIAVEGAIVAPALALTAAVMFAQVVADPVAAAQRVGRAWVVLTAAAVAGFAVLLATPSLLTATIAGVIIGLLCDALARILGAEGPRVMAVRDAIKKARDAATTSDPNDVARGVLSSLSTMVVAPRAAPRLLLFTPMREVVLDAAGEARVRDPVDLGDPDAPSAVSRVVPSALLSLAAAEPLGVVRTSVLRAREVRRPDLRSALRFCESRDAAAVVSVIVDGDLDGLLLVPEAPGVELGLRDVRALRAISRLCATRLSLEAALARASARAQRAELRAREIEHVVERAHHRVERLSRSLSTSSRPLERRVATGYGPASRAILGEIDALAKSNAHLVVLHRPGTDPVPWIARLHRESGRPGALHVVDVGRKEGADASAWSDPELSPIELARDGTLCVLAAPAMPRDAQKRLLSALSFREGPGPDPTPIELRVVLAVACADPEQEGLDRLRGLDTSLVDHLRSTPVRLLPLSRRTEDIHSIALDRLAALGIAMGREPLGLAPEALALLVEHEWSGDDLELDDVLTRAAVSATSRERPRVEAADLRVVLGLP
jgi:hypothetical protein